MIPKNTTRRLLNSFIQTKTAIQVLKRPSRNSKKPSLRSKIPKMVSVDIDLSDVENNKNM